MPVVIISSVLIALQVIFVGFMVGKGKAFLFYISLILALVNILVFALIPAEWVEHIHEVWFLALSIIFAGTFSLLEIFGPKHSDRHELRVRENIIDLRSLSGWLDLILVGLVVGVLLIVDLVTGKQLNKLASTMVDVSAGLVIALGIHRVVSNPHIIKHNTEEVVVVAKTPTDSAPTPAPTSPTDDPVPPVR